MADLNKGTYAYIPAEILDDVIYKVTCLVDKKNEELTIANRKVAELNDKLANVTSRNRTLEAANEELRARLRQVTGDDW